MRPLVLCVLIAACSETPTPEPTLSPGTENPTPFSPVNVIADPTLAMTTLGSVRGIQRDAVVVFRGIPYARPPVDGLRFRPPTAHAGWSEPFAASEFGSPCYQTTDAGNAIGSEDCLTLNVWTPSLQGAARPVMVFFHGGYNQRGSTDYQMGGLDAYDGTHFANAGAVFITANYRVGPFGWLSHASLEDAAAEGASGNYGLWDQRFALQWIRQNAAAFGGDPERIMVFGQSAGAIDTCLLLASPKTTGLFSRAAILSGSCSALKKSDAYELGSDLASALKCSAGAEQASCLRGATREEILAAAKRAFDVKKGFGFNPHVDGVLVPGSPVALLGKEPSALIPLIVGTTAEEFTTMYNTVVGEPIEDDEDYLRVAKKMFGDAAGEWIVTQYPSSDYRSPQDAFIAIMSDSSFHCPARTIARARARVGGSTWRYVFSGNFGVPSVRRWGAGHGVDLFYVFRLLTAFGHQPTDDEKLLSDGIVRYLVQFADTGNPNQEGLTEWPAFETNDERFLNWDTSFGVSSNFRNRQCDLFE